MPQALTKVASLSALREAGRKLVKVDGRQILLIADGDRIYACNNRCPHEGFPLIEGTVARGTPAPGTRGAQGASARGCVLTCNWHNWKFDLAGGETLLGGDRLRRYPVEVRGDGLWLDLSDPPPEETIRHGLENLAAGFERFEFDRMGRELARLEGAGAGPERIIRAVIGWSHRHLELGFAHAYAATEDWLALRERLPAGAPPEAHLVPLLEAVSHIAWDSRREPLYPYPEAACRFSEQGLVAAIEAEDEAEAIAHVRGALAEGLSFDDLEPALAGAALAHYHAFGHSVIYLGKTRRLIARLGGEVAEPLLLALTRHLIIARREDLIPEFRAYASALGEWDAGGGAGVSAEDFQGLSLRAALKLTAANGGNVEALYDALLGAAAWNMLHFDLGYDRAFDGSVAQNIGWLDFTHGLTMAAAIRELCGRYPDQWPRALLQLACFVGRNKVFVDPDLDATRWRVEDPEAFLAREFDALLDHGEFLHIIACHRLKVLTVVRDGLAEGANAQVVLAAVNRYLNSPIKRKHLRRTARQSLAFVAAEG